MHIGGNDTGQIAKACNQVLVAQGIAAAAEALLLAQSAGADAAKVREALLGGFAASPIFEVHAERTLEEDFSPGFKTALHRKGMGIALHSADQAGIKLCGNRVSGRVATLGSRGAGLKRDVQDHQTPYTGLRRITSQTVGVSRSHANGAAASRLPSPATE